MNLNLDWLAQVFPTISSLQPIGRGGQKIVFSGNHNRDGKVVLKLFHIFVDPERAIREVQAVQDIGSARVPKILEVGTTNAPFGDVMWVREQYVPGEDLRNILSRGKLKRNAILLLALQVLEVLAAAEKAGITHRDVKPENIRVDQNGNCWLLDFGIARHLRKESLTATADTFGLGTPGYAPPEQFRNRKPDIDARSDLFALGVTLYECAEGNNPFISEARDVGEVLRRVETVPLPPISRNIEETGAFRDLVLAMTRTKLDHRLPTAAEGYLWIKEICSKEALG
ncbi:MAG TPA: serine/threonine-protein kinase [Blastocatellia bacterium]|nr:serine/threonine-protein kinase [Blastocatellia bacterium]